MKVKCEECESEFTHKKSLYVHIRNIHKKNLVVLKKNPLVKCDDCAVEFSQKKHLYAHARKFHKKDLFVHKKNPDFKCATCNKTFSLKSTLHKHEVTHKGQTDHQYANFSQKKSRILCPEKSCVSKFSTHESLRKHLSIVHKIVVEKEDHEFDSLEGFERWKDNIQQKEMSAYTLDSAPKKLSTVEAWNLFYNCHRSFSYAPEGKNIRSLKSVGSNKMGRACPSRMKVTMKEDLKQPSLVKVEYWKTHFGHELELGHVFLDNRTRTDIAAKLNQGVSFSHILDTIRDNMSDMQNSNQRLLILERKDLHNIVRDFNINYSTKRHQNDAISVKLWVSEMQGAEENPVLYYKGQDEEDRDTSLNDSDFALMIMTLFQAEQFIKFGKNKICIDGTHGTNPYDIQLYTVMTVDEFGAGCPVAYCLSNRSDEYIFALFFEKIKSRVGLIDTHIFMSDDAPAFYNAWASVMGQADHKLLCSWHVDRNWRSNLNKIGDVEKKVLVYKTLKVLQQMTDISEFENGLMQVLNQLKTDMETNSFGIYLQNHYANRCESWAYCYRIGLGINTNMYLESYHKILKHIYLEGKKVKRLDKTLDAVLKLARDSLFKRLINVSKNKRTEKIQQINSSHKSSLSISMESIKTIEKDKQWLVLSSSSPSTEYLVSFIQTTCCSLCLACTACKICVHTFQCSCNDNVIKLNICKHIHACARVYQENCSDNTEHAQDFDKTSEVSRLLNMSQTVVPQICTNESLIKKFEVITGLLSKVNNLSPQSACTLERYADNCLSLLNKQDMIVLKTTEKVNVQQKVEKQLRLYSTKAKRQKVNTEFSKPSTVEVTAIKDGLINPTGTLNVHSEFDHIYE